MLCDITLYITSYSSYIIYLMPYDPSSFSPFQALFEEVLPRWAASRGVPLRGLRLVDFGSGDGRLLQKAAQRGMRATGYELNPWAFEKGLVRGGWEGGW